MFGWFWVSIEGWKETAPWTRELDSVLKSISIWSPAYNLNLKMWILKMRAPQAKNFEIFWNWENGHRMNWPPPKKYNPSLLKSKIFWPPPNSKITTPPALAGGGGAHYAIDPDFLIADSDQLVLRAWSNKSRNQESFHKLFHDWGISRHICTLLVQVTKQFSRTILIFKLQIHQICHQ